MLQNNHIPNSFEARNLKSFPRFQNKAYQAFNKIPNSPSKIITAAQLIDYGEIPICISTEREREGRRGGGGEANRVFTFHFDFEVSALESFDKNLHFRVVYGRLLLRREETSPIDRLYREREKVEKDWEKSECASKEWEERGERREGEESALDSLLLIYMDVPLRSPATIPLLLASGIVFNTNIPTWKKPGFSQLLKQMFNKSVPSIK